MPNVCVYFLHEFLLILCLPQDYAQLDSKWFPNGTTYLEPVLTIESGYREGNSNELLVKVVDGKTTPQFG